MPSYIWNSTTRSYQNLQIETRPAIDRFEAIKDWAVRSAWPLNTPPSNPQLPNEESYVNRRVNGKTVETRNERERAKLTDYFKARIRSWEKSTRGNSYPPRDIYPMPGKNPSYPNGNHRHYADCGKFVATAVLASGFDTDYPASDTQIQWQYLQSSPKWTKVGDHRDYTTLTLETGDVFITRGKGHTFLWIGNYGGYTDVIAEASFYSKDNDPRLRNPTLRRYHLATGEDDSVGFGRDFEIYRCTDPRAVTPSMTLSGWGTGDAIKNITMTVQNRGENDTFAANTTITISFSFHIPGPARLGQEIPLLIEAPSTFRRFTNTVQISSDNVPSSLTMARMTWLNATQVTIKLPNPLPMPTNTPASWTTLHGTASLVAVATEDMIGQPISGQQVELYGAEEEVRLPVDALQ